MLPALYFEPVMLPFAAAMAAVTELAGSSSDLVLVVFPEGDVGDDGAAVEVGRVSNAWPYGARRRSLPLLPALRLTGAHGRSRDELAAAAAARLAAMQLRRRFAHDALVLRADGAISAVFWTISSAGRDRGASPGRPRSS
ncbi:MAG: hypothetical protein QOG42_1498 [Solirubrobacteraceae bacterium]|jgi:hypothetical protein|nr:hypothetical protein [Solirubrobacteraceae bacterium]